MFLILVTPLLFGSVYPWAHALIQMVTVLMVGVWLVRVLVLGKGGAPGVPNRKLFLPAALFFLLILFQVVPLPPGVVRTLSPGTANLYTTFLADLAPEAPPTGFEPGTDPEDEGAAAASRPEGEPGTGLVVATAARTLSLDPDRTRREGMLFLSYVALLYLFINHKPEGSTRRFVGTTLASVTLAGILVTFAAIVQKVLGASRIYGFWQPVQETALPFMGPYVNANHYAGYMELVLPPILALFVAWAAAARRNAKGPSHYMDILQSPANNKVVLGLMGFGVMVLTLFLSFSRAGVASFLLTAFVLFMVLGRMEARFRPANWRRVRRAWRAVFLACFLLFSALALPVFLLKHGGLEEIGEEARFRVWGDTLRMARDFPLFGAGLNSFSSIHPHYKSLHLPTQFTHAENDYVQMLAETGLIGFGLVLLFFGLFFRETRRLFRWRAKTFLDEAQAGEEPAERATTGDRSLRYGPGPRRNAVYPLPRTNYYLFWGCVGSILSLALHSLADFNLHIPANGLLFFLLLGIMYRLLRLREPVFILGPGRTDNP